MPGLKDDARDLLGGLIGCGLLAVIFWAIALPLLYFRSTFLHKLLIAIAFPLLVVLAWNGYPLAYYKLTGRRFIRHLDPSPFGSDYHVIDGCLYKHRGYDRENMWDKTLTPQQRGWEPHEQEHEYIVFKSHDLADPTLPPRFKGELTTPDKRNQRFQFFCRAIFLLIILALSEPWLNALGTSWRRILNPSP